MEGIALVTGGIGKSIQSSVEVYGPGGMTKRLDDFIAVIGHSLDYLEGAVYFCGGAKPKVDPSNICFKGEPNHSKKGLFLHIICKFS